MYRTKRRRKTKRKVRRKRQTGGFLNCSDFAYAGRDVVNQVAKVAPGVIKGATKEIEIIDQRSINQIISQGGKEVECVLPKVLRGAIKDVYQTPFRLVGNFGKKQFNKLKKEISNNN